jgi:oligoribonuclease NrnB/cAMP/cGMP phosphodiesterase (DHH superfamily)
MGIKVIWHADCVDGFTAAWSVWRKFGSEAEFIPGVYNADPPVHMLSGHDVFLVDFCYDWPWVQKLAGHAKSITILDHHKTAQAGMASNDLPNVKCVFDMDRSGASIAWDYFHGENSNVLRPWIVSYAEDSDLFRFKLPNSRPIRAYMQTLDKTFETWERVFREGMEKAADSGEILFLGTKSYVKEMSVHARRIDFLGHGDVPVVNAPRPHTSELLNHLAESADFAAGWWQREDRKIIYSLRSKGDFDVSALAETQGGGGHFHAAGFTADALVHEL